MLFNSFSYILLFLPAVLIIVAVAKRRGGPIAAQVAILIASIIFYAWFRWTNLVFLAASVLANWYLAKRIAGAKDETRKRWLQAGLIANIAYLCTFKYVNFLLGSLPFMHGHEHLIPDLEFPLGISFFTLTQIMYLVDCYERVVKPSSLFDHATFVSFFPYVISGPLATVKRTRKQFRNFGGTPGAYAPMIARGIYLFSLGLFKKTVCATAFSQIADYGFNNAVHRSSLETFIYSATYCFQLYFDFSGYSDMAIGTADMLGITIPRNFDAPLRSKSIIEYWRRWHVSLSSFITTYLYTPILRSFGKASLPKAMLATFLAMTIAGLWHGPSWNFVIFGVLHGVALALNSAWTKKSPIRLPGWFSWLLTFCFVDIAFIFFRSPTLAAAMQMLHDLFSVHHALSTSNLTAMRANFSWPIFGPPIAVGVATAFFGESSEQMAQEFTPTWKTTILSGAALTVAAVFMNSQISATFIYFKF